jgi:hypothetical protein
VRAAIACSLVALGCGRIGFDERTGALIGHDEDGDGVLDAVDVCPQGSDQLRRGFNSIQAALRDVILIETR